MIWKALTYGTAILASLTLGTAIYYSGDRIQVKTEDMTELLEAVSERQLSLTTTITTQRMGYQETQWTDAAPAASWDGTNLHNGYWSYDGTTNPVPTSYKVPTGEITHSNTFITTGQWLRAWVPVYTNVGRVRDIPNTQYTVTVTEDEGWYPEWNGTYNWVTSLWTSAGVDSHVYAKADESAVLVATPQDKTYGWQLGSLWWGSPIEWRDNLWDTTGTPRSQQCGGSIKETHWPHPYYGVGKWIRVTVTESGSSLEGHAITNATGQWSGPPWVYTITTNINIIRPLEFPARSITNIANAVQLQNFKALIDSVDYAIGYGTGHEWPGGFIGSFVDMSQASGGTFDAYFAANTNATTFPKMTLRRAFEILGPTCGTNIPWAYGLTNAVWLTFPARGTNPPVYGGTMTHVTKEALTARFKVLQLLCATERSPAWWTGVKDSKNNAPYDDGTWTNYYDTADACDGATAWANGMKAPAGDFTLTLGSLLSNVTTIVTGQAPASVAQVYSFQLSPVFSSWLYYDPLNALYTHGAVPYPHHFWGPGYHPAVPETTFSATISGAGTNAGSLGWYVYSGAKTGAYTSATYYTTKAKARVTNVMLTCLEEAQFYARDYTNSKALNTFSKRADGELITMASTNYVLTTTTIEPLPPPADYLSLTITAPLKTNWVSALCGEGWYVLDPNGSGWGYNSFGLVEDLTYAGLPDYAYGLWPHDTSFNGSDVWTYQYTGAAQGTRTWTAASTNRPSVSKTVTAGPVLLKWDFQYCAP